MGTDSTKIIWALDIFGSDNRAQSKALELLRLIADDTVVVEPVYVMSPDYLRVAAELFPAEAQSLKAATTEKLLAWHKNQKWDRLLEPTTLVADGLNLRSCVSALLEYARRTQAGSIIVSTHAHRGIKRYLLGSFAELLVTHSELPVFLLNPRAVVPEKIRRIVFGYDFSDVADSVLVRVAALAREHQAELIVFHQLDTVAAYPADLRSLWPSVAQVDRARVAQYNESADRLIERLTGYGVRASFKLRQKPAAAADSILEQAERSRADLIALVSRRGSVTASIAGSVCRQVCRRSERPVWVLHPGKV